MKFLVTGSNGFIGSHTVRYLKNKGHYVIGLGRRDTFTGDLDKYIRCDLSDVGDRKILEKNFDEDIDAVMHIAADMRKEPYTTEVVQANCVGTQGLLEICEEKKINVFVQLSSLPVIDFPRQHPITEEHPTYFHSVYHATKAMQEHLAQYAYDYHGLKTASFRISAPIGIGVDETTILPVFVKKALKNEKLEIWGKGKREQTFVHVDDMSSAMLAACEHPENLGGGGIQPLIRKSDFKFGIS